MDDRDISPLTFCTVDELIEELRKRSTNFVFISSPKVSDGHMQVVACGNRTYCRGLLLEATNYFDLISEQAWMDRIEEGPEHD